ncbi:MAG: tRNA (adenosine(37)-N6)-threonylcarbamoyltransferase complex ATPase subunit type 1 TsaE [Gammaproteobacteria bacterium]
MHSISEWLPDDAATRAFGARLKSLLQPGDIVYLQGDLGAGKTTLVRALLRSMGYKGVVKSPTYTLIETYHPDALTVHHLDVYRLTEPEELEWLGIRDLFDKATIALIEWPEKGVGFLPPATVTVSLAVKQEGRQIEVSRGLSESYERRES